MRKQSNTPIISVSSTGNNTHRIYFNKASIKKLYGNKSNLKGDSRKTLHVKIIRLPESNGVGIISCNSSQGMTLKCHKNNFFLTFGNLAQLLANVFIPQYAEVHSNYFFKLEMTEAINVKINNKKVKTFPFAIFKLPEKTNHNKRFITIVKELNDLVTDIHSSNSATHFNQLSTIQKMLKIANKETIKSSL